MVDFRYHIVSIVAIFLALAVGIVLGAGPLKTTSDAQLKAQVGDLRTSTRTLQDSLGTAQAEVQFLDRFGAEAAPGLLSNRLAGLKVAVVSLPGADPALAAGLVTALLQANATVTVQARITSSWTDPGHQTELAAAVGAGEATATPTVSTGPAPGVSSAGSLPPSPASSSQLQSASATVYSDVAAELATGLLTSAAVVPVPLSSPLPSVAAPASPSPTRRVSRGTASRAGSVTSPAAPGTSPARLVPGAARTAPSTAAVAARTLAALVSGGFVSLSGAVPLVHPTLAVVVAADPPATATDTSRAANAELATLAEALRDASDGTVLAGSGASAGDGGLLALVRASRPTAGELSTVDSVDSVVGRIAVPLALLQQQSDGTVGQYGSVGSTDGPLPQVNGIGPG